MVPYLLFKFTHIRYLNYYEGRILPYQYEDDIYLKARAEAFDKEQLVDIGCNSTVDDQLESYIQSAKTVLGSNAMKAAGG